METIMTNLRIQVQHWVIDRLIVSDDNPRVHSIDQIAQIATSIDAFGFINPVIVNYFHASSWVAADAVLAWPDVEDPEPA